MDLDLQRVRANVRSADTEDLLDRATVYRAGMEPEALEVIDRELRERGVSAGDIAVHAERRQRTLLQDPDGRVRECRRCHRPAVVVGWEWGRLWWLLPLFPRRAAYCEEHRPREKG